MRVAATSGARYRIRDVQNAGNKVDNQQEPTVEHMELLAAWMGGKSGGE